MKKIPMIPFLPTALAYGLLVAGAQAQTIRFSGDTFPTGEFGGREEINYTMTVGSVDDGVLAVSDGAVLAGDRRVVIGQLPGSTGTVNITGGAEWHTGMVWSGQRGTAHFNVSGGAKVTSGHTYFGMGPQGVSTATVEGPGSSWIIPDAKNSDFWLGENGGTGTLRVLNGGTVYTPSDINASMTTGSASYIDIDGINSSFTVKDICNLGMIGPTTVRITNGGTFNCGRNNSYLSTGHIALSGAGSRFFVPRDFSVGRAQISSKAALSIGEGSVVEVAGNVLLPAGTTYRPSGSGTLNIEGSHTPGILRANSILFGEYGESIVNFKHSDTSGNYHFAPSMSGEGLVTVTGGGTTVLTGNNSHKGQTSVQAGVLRAGSATALAGESAYTVGRAGTLDTNDFGLAAYLLANAGTVTMGAGNTTAVISTSNYVGYRGTLRMNAALAGNASPTQKLIAAAGTSGTTTLHITNVGGAGAQTTGNGILLVQVGMESNAVFSLAAPGYVQAGNYRYTLVKQGRNWYLQSAPVAPMAAKALPGDASLACAGHADTAEDCVAALALGTAAQAPLTAGSATAASATAESAGTDNRMADVEALLAGNDLDDPDGFKDSDAAPMADAVPVPSLGLASVVSLSALMGLAGLRRSRPAL